MNNDDLENLDDPSAAPRIRPDAASERRSERSYAAVPSGGRDVHLLDYVRVLSKRRWLASTVFLLVFGSVAAYTFTATPIFEAKTRLLIESDERNVVTFQQVVDEDQAKVDYYLTQYNILQSRALARKTLDDLNLWDTPPFGVEPSAKASLTGTIRGAPSAVLSFFRRGNDDDDVAENANRGADETGAQSRAIDVLLGGLSVSPIRNSRLVDVKYRSPDAALATKLVNALSNAYIEQNLEYKFLASKEASDWLGERLAEQRKQVEDAELALQRYREQNDAISLEDSENIVVQKLGDLNAAVTRAKMNRIEKEGLYNQLRANQSNPAALDAFPAILANSFIQQQKAELASLQREQAQLSEKLLDKHPDMQRVQVAVQLARSRLNGEIAKVVAAVRSEYQAALAQENSLTAALTQQKSEALSMNRKAINYTVLRRDVDSTRQIYDSLMQRAKETGVTGELKTNNIRVVDTAERPRSPVSPRTRLNMILGFLLATVLALGLAFFFEYLDNRIKTPEELRAHLGLPFLGMVPAVSLKSGSAPSPLLSGGAPALFAEAVRVLRTNVMFSVPNEGGRSVVVTSTGPGEGKSVVAANLAIGLAQSGQRVLLIDADLRRPQLHKRLRQSAEPGLSNLLVGQAKASEVVRKSDVAGLWLLPAGRIPPNPAELLGSQRFKEFLATLGQHFDWVLIDTPPVLAVADASIIAHSASGVLFVVGAEMVSRYAARAALDSLETARARCLGAVLNKVDLERNAYYYSDHYRREYAQYYTQLTEAAARGAERA